MPRESITAKRQRAQAIVSALAAAYPQSRCALQYASAFQLLVATVLSAQTTDLAVNRVTRRLFAQYPTAQEMARAPPGVIEEALETLGLWRAKARHVRALSAALVRHHGRQVPRDLEALLQLPGVGKKTATAVLGTAYGMAAGITVDTHMLRIHRLLGLSRATTADAMARDLERLVAREHWTTYTHRVIDHGRLVCVARRPRCGVCPLSVHCVSSGQERVGYRPRNDEREPISAAGLSWRAHGVDDPQPPFGAEAPS